jgi:hypothetical protein
MNVNSQKERTIMNRRLATKKVLALAAGASAAAAMSADSTPHAKAAPIVRVSMGWFPPEKVDEVAALLDYTGRPLATAIKALPGLVAYYSGIDRKRHAMVNVSIWKDEPSAEQMGSLQAMLDQGAVLTRLGVKFVRPIANFETVWSA